MWFDTILLLLIVGYCNGVRNQQVHLSYHGEPSQMVATWLTKKPLTGSKAPWVAYGTKEDNLDLSVLSSIQKWTDLGTDLSVRYTYRAAMTNLVPGQTYYYNVGDDKDRSSTFHFNATDPSKPLRAAIFGDFSIESGFSLNALINATQEGDLDIIFHIGDIAYDLHNKNGDVGDDFMNAVEPISAQIPYMVIAGNHEHSQDFNHLRHRFTMPSNGLMDDNQFWSFSHYNTHFIGISTEYYGYNMSHEAQVQYEWLLEDLKQVKDEWIVLFMHRPMYCSNGKKHGCEADENTRTRNGAPSYPALEPLFNHAGIDMVFWGHEHGYERDWPIFESTSYPQADAQQYHNSPTPVYTMTGAAGCHSHVDPKDEVRQPFTAVQLPQYGFSVLKQQSDKTQIKSHFVDAITMDHLDKFTLTKDPGFRPGSILRASKALRYNSLDFIELH